MTEKTTAKGKTLRSIQGCLVMADSMEEEKDQMVILVGDDLRPHLYYLPAECLRGAGIIAENQPFRMDEIEDEPGKVRYEFTALAKPSEAYPARFELSDERKRKVTLIFKAFGRPRA